MHQLTSLTLQPFEKHINKQIREIIQLGCSVCLSWELSSPSLNPETLQEETGIWCPISCWLAGRYSKETWKIPFLNKKGSCQHQLMGINANKPSQSWTQPCHMSAPHYCTTLCKSASEKNTTRKEETIILAGSALSSAVPAASSMQELHPSAYKAGCRLCTGSPSTSTAVSFTLHYLH